MITLEDLAGRATSTMSEDDLVRGYATALSPVVRTVPCACGGTLSAPQGDDRAISLAVSFHNESTTHRQWRIAVEASE